MIKAVPFLGISAILVALVWYLGGVLPPTDPFAGSGVIPSLRLDRLSGQTLAKLKLNHARGYGRYDRQQPQPERLQGRHRDRWLQLFQLFCRQRVAAF